MPDPSRMAVMSERPYAIGRKAPAKPRIKLTPENIARLRQEHEQPAPEQPAPVVKPPPSGSRHHAHTGKVTKWPAPTEPPRDARGYRRAVSTMPGALAGRAPANKGKRYPATPPTAAEVVQLMRSCPDTPMGHRLRGFIVFAWRTGLRVSEALAVVESDINLDKGSVIVQRGKGDKRRVVGIDRWGVTEFRPWLTERLAYPAGEVFCVLEGPTAGRGMDSQRIRLELHRLAARAGIRKRCAPHQLRHAWTIEALRDGMSLPMIQRQLGHANLAITTRYLAGIAHEELLEEVFRRHAPSMSVPDLMAVLDSTPPGAPRTPELAEVRRV